MKKLIILLCCIMMLSAVAYAEDEGLYLVKNVKVPISTKDGNTVMNDTLIKIDTTTGRVWEWVDIRTKESIHTEWVEMKDSDLQPSKKSSSAKDNDPLGIR